MRLIDADKADVERISCFYGGECHIKDVQEWLDEQPTVNLYEWINVKDRLPEQFGKYLVVCKGIGISQIRLWEGTWDSFAEVTHWMPLPEPPEDNKKNILRGKDIC